MAASLQTLDISAPEYPSVNLTNFSHSMPPFSSESYIPFKLILKSSNLPLSVGRGMSKMFNKNSCLTNSFF